MSNEIDVPGHLQAILSEMRKVAAEQRTMNATLRAMAEELDERAPATATEVLHKTRREWEALHEDRRRLDEQARQLGELRSGVEWLNGEVRSLGAQLRALEPRPDNRE